MKQLIILFFPMACLTQTVRGQVANKPTALQVYGSVGARLLQPKYFDHDANVSPAAVPTLGAGVLWQARNFLVGGEFAFADGKKNTSDRGSIFTGFTFSALGGYQWSINEKFAISIQSGFGYSLYHLAVTDKAYSGTANLNTAVYHNFLYSVPVSLTVQRTGRHGTFVGARAGYHFPVMPNEWRYIEGATTEAHATAADAFFVQLMAGGLLTRNQFRP